MDFSVCIDSVFQGQDPLNALDKVKSCGFSRFEFWSWWDKDIDAIKRKAESLSLNCAAICTQFISLTISSRRKDYIAGLKASVKAAEKLGCKILISQAGDDSGEPRAVQHRSIVEGLKEAAPLLEESGIVLVLEPLNIKIDHAGYYLYSSDEGFEIVEKTGSDNVKLLFDIYHQQITEGDIIHRIGGNIERIGHFHTAGVPGRHELYSGELDYNYIIQAVKKTPYEGFIGIEYFPVSDGTAGLKRTAEYLGIAADR
jgi:hydroxypyruvate isomerase